MLGAALLLAACTREPTAAGLPDSTFVATMVQLRRIHADSTLDSMMKDSARRETLRAHGLTAATLEQAARALADHPQRAMNVFKQIDRESAPRAMVPTTPVPPQGAPPPRP